MKESAVIEKDILPEKEMDLNALREEGIERLQELSGNKWTDHNIHDPGVTILETLCYALADLAYRADFDINDILYTTPNKKPGNTLYEPHEVLTTAPLSAFDFKALILDIDGVKNCDIVPSYNEKVIPGSFDVKIELQPDYDDDLERSEIKEKVSKLLKSQRPIGVVFDKVEFLEFDPVGILLEIELSERVEPKDILSESVRKIQEYFSPQIKFWSLPDLQKQGTPIDHIFEGPLLKNGFLPAEELQSHALRNTVFISDLVNLVMSIHGVSFVRNMKVVSDNDEEHNWTYSVKENKVPKINPLKTRIVCKYKNVNVFEGTSNLIELLSVSKINHRSSYTNNKLKKKAGEDRKLSSYYSIQNDFPETYGVGAKGAPAGANVKKLAAINQLKGYLLIYDQIMANFLSQLDHVKYLFSTEKIENTYAVQLMDDVPGIEMLYKQFIEIYYVNYNNLDDKRNIKAEWVRFLNENKGKLKEKIQRGFETQDEFLERRNRVLDHLLARLGIDTLKLELLIGMTQKEIISFKLNFLRNYPKLSYEKYSMGESSVFKGKTGLDSWLMMNTCLNGFHSSKFSDLAKMVGFNEGSSGINIEVYSNDEPLNTLLKYGTEINNYLENDNEVSVFNDKNEIVTKFNFDNENIQDKTLTAYNKIKELDIASERFIIIDHISLKPSDEMPCFGVDVIFNGKPFFVSDRKFSLSQLDIFTEEFSKQAKNGAGFLVVETSLKEFRIRFDSKAGTLFTRNYFSSVKEANDQLDLFIESFKDQPFIFSYFSKYENHYVNISNPFSFVVTVVLPTWPSKFQKAGFKKYIEDYFSHELPAHMAVNIKWLDYDAMNKFESAWEEYKGLQQQDAITKLSALDKIMIAMNF
jgi:hypothetical protein